jgi:hypothetical protein
MVAGMAHKPGSHLFEEGNQATPGIEAMAEDGINTALQAEVETLVGTGTALGYLAGPGLVTGFSEVTFEITVTAEFPLVTLVSMIAPSPDWFVAVENIELFKNGVFEDNLTADAIAYDSGTDGGDTYQSADEDTDPAANISRITGEPLGNGTTVDPPVAMFAFVRTD